MFLFLQKIGASHHLIHGAKPQLRHVLPQLPGYKDHKIHHVFRFSLESLAQLRVLGSDAHGTGVQIADPHHHAAQGHQGSGGETELLGAQQRGHRHIPAGHQLAIGLQHHLVPKSVFQQRLVGFRQAQLPRQAGVLDGTDRSSSRSPVVAGDQNHLGPRFGNARGHGANACLGHQFDGYAGVFVSVFQIVDQLGQVLDGVNIMVGRRRDQAHARGGMAGFRHPGIYLFGWQMSPFPGFCALGHLDLNLLCADQITAGHSETAAGNLFDRTAPIPVRAGGHQALVTLPSLAAV